MNHSRIKLNLQTLFVLRMIILWITIIHCFVLNTLGITFDRKKPPPPGGVPIYYVPRASSRIVRKRTPLEEPGTISYCSVNLTGLGGRGGKVKERSARCVRALNLITLLNLFFVTATLNNSPPAFRHCK